MYFKCTRYPRSRSLPNKYVAFSVVAAMNSDIHFKMHQIAPPNRITYFWVVVAMNIDIFMLFLPKYLIKKMSYFSYPLDKSWLSLFNE